ncbi:MAG: replication initiation protein [Planctomycetaceae bacterium]|nr:replication initiation protein [Planctomycetaceae bacterium]
MGNTLEKTLPLFSNEDVEGIQPTGSPWIVSNDDPATVPVPLQVLITKVEGPYTARDRKLWTFLLHAAFEELGDKPIHSVKVRDVNDMFRKQGGQHETNWIWKSAKRLSKTTIEFETTMGDERFLGVAALFGANVPAKAKRGSELHFFFPPNLIPIIKEPMRFARLRVHFMMQLSGKYAVTLYEILEGFTNRRDGQCRVTIEELRTWLKVPEQSYQNWKDFRKWVLDPAIKQINDDPLGAGFVVEYEPIRKGRFYNEIIFKLAKTKARIGLDRTIKGVECDSVLNRHTTRHSCQDARESDEMEDSVNYNGIIQCPRNSPTP